MNRNIQPLSRRTRPAWGGLVLVFLGAGLAIGGERDQELQATFDGSETAPLVRHRTEPTLFHSDYIELVKLAHPTSRENWEFYEIFIAYRDAYARQLPSLFDNPSWPLFIALRSEQQLKIQRIKNRARHGRRTWTPSSTALSTASLGSVNKDVRSVTHHDHVRSAHSVVPERSNALGNAYRWVNGKWIFSGKGYRRVNGKWEKIESELGLQGADGLE